MHLLCEKCLKLTLFFFYTNDTFFMFITCKMCFFLFYFFIVVLLFFVAAVVFFSLVAPLLGGWSRPWLIIVVQLILEFTLLKKERDSEQVGAQVMS